MTQDDDQRIGEAPEEPSVELPGGEGISHRPIQFFFVVDASGSMAGRKIDSLNHAIREAVPAMRKAADANPGVRVEVRALRFSDGAQWHLPGAMDVNDFEWVDIADPGGLTALGEALRLLAPELDVPPLPERTKPPVIVLVSDGHPTDQWKSGLAELLAKPWGQKSIRLAVGVGEDVDMEALHEFMGGNPEIKPLQATDAPTLIRYMKWASTVGVTSSSAPRAAAQAVDLILAVAPAPVPADQVKPEDVF